MFNVGGPEIMVILLIALMVLGPDQLPKAMRTLGSVRAEVRKVTDGFQAEVRKVMETDEAAASDPPAARPVETTPAPTPSAASTPAPAAATSEVDRAAG